MKTCDLCDGCDFELIAQRDRRGEPLATCVCRRCGLVCHHDIPTDEQLQRYYASEYRQDYHGELSPSARRVDRAWRNGQRILAQLAPLVERGSKVLEVGAGIGCTVKSFELAGYPATGIDPGVGFAHYGQRQLRADVRTAQLGTLPQRPLYDLVLLVHVIEHFNSPRRALEQIHGLLQPGGRLYVECPNLGAPFARRSQLFHFAHIHNFTPQTLAMLARRCGYEVERIFSAADEPNLQMLLLKAGAMRLKVDPASYTCTMTALERSNNLPYYARWSYVWTKFRRLPDYFAEHVLAKRRVQRLLQRCQRSNDTAHAPVALLRGVA